MTLTDKEKLEDERAILSLLIKIEGLVGAPCFTEKNLSGITSRQLMKCLEEIIEEAKCVRFSDSLLEPKKEIVLIKLIHLHRFVQFSDWRVTVKADLEEIKKILFTSITTFKSNDPVPEWYWELRDLAIKNKEAKDERLVRKRTVL